MRAIVKARSSPRTSFSCGARFERATDPRGANAERTQSEAQSRRHVTAALDHLPACAVIVVNDELALLPFQLLQTPTNPLEPLPFDRESFTWLVRWHTGAGRCDGNPRLAKSDRPGLAPDILKQDRLRDHITVLGWRRGRYRAVVLQRPADAAERFARQVVCGRSIPPIEIRDESPPHLKVPFAL